MTNFRIEVTYRKGVEDPEAITVARNLKILGYSSIRNVNISKTYELTIEGSEQDGEKIAREISEKILSNPVIQSFRILR